MVVYCMRPLVVDYPQQSKDEACCMLQADKLGTICLLFLAAVRTDSSNRTHCTVTQSDWQLPASSPTQQMHSPTGNWHKIGKKHPRLFRSQPHKTVHQGNGGGRGRGVGFGVIFWLCSLRPLTSICQIWIMPGSVMFEVRSYWVYTCISRLSWADS